ncbi:MAG: M1 family aminopeptidase, partial [Bryobacteraceae bacterium]
MAVRIPAFLGLIFTLAAGFAQNRQEAGKGAVQPNSDPNYRALREATPNKTVRVSNLRIERDAAVFLLKSGLITFAAPVLDRVTTAVFSGDGEFQFMPALPIEVSYLKALTGKQDVTEPFDALALQFTDGTYDEIMKAAQPAEIDSKARGILQDFRKRARYNTEHPRSGLEAGLTGEGVANFDTEVLAGLYNPAAPGFFRAFIFGKKHNDLRFIVNSLGAFPQMMAPEEVALLNLDPGGAEEGVWYLSHTLDEMRANRASSEEDKRIIDAEHYRIENVIRGTRLTAVSELTFKALRAGDRVLSFGLLPSLRVTRVVFADRDIAFIQENRKDDGAFAAVLPEPLVKDQSYKIRIEYSGDKVLSNEGGGNFSVGARTSWYPSLNAFNDRATFDLIFKVPRNFTLVSVGNRVEEHREGDLAVSQWVSKVPLAVAGFNYGQFKRKDLADTETRHAIEGYATSELPGYLKEFGDEIMSTSPSSLTNKALAETQASLKIFTRYFGESPYGRIAITQQPELAFGQSWPMLVYLPIIAYLDSTQRWKMFGINNRLTEFIQEVTPHEVAHQWWGHIVGWASYHDQWLSEGFADFS